MTRQTFVRWVVAFLGFPVGGLAATSLIGVLENPLDGLLGGLIAGAGIGLAHGLALRASLWRWALASALGLGVGVWAGVVLFSASHDLATILMRAPLAGLGLGAAQAVLVRGTLRLAWAWPLLTAGMFVAAWWVSALVITTNLQAGFVVFGASGALLYQGVTGLALWGGRA
ncbi:MAG: hypothetical protein MUC99_07125 [Anaerolineae bacterium]|jgi:hypothetical protein|nr:hypothetical protein [Anaerolineae bacterium]